MYLHINGNERDFIAVQKSQGISIRSIAKKLGRSPASAAQVDFQAEEGRRWRWWGWSRIKFFRNVNSEAIG